MRVVHTVASLGARTGGPARSVPGLVDALADQGISVAIVALDDERTSGKPLRPKHPRVDTCLVPPMWTPLGALPWSPSFAPRLTDRLSVERPVVAHDHGIWLPTNLIALRCARAARARLVVSPHGMLEPWSRGQRWLKKRIAWWLYQGRQLRSVALLHATSSDEADSLSELGLLQPIAVIPHGVEGPPRLLTRRHQRPRTALFLSRMHAKKGVDMLLRSWAVLRPEGWRLMLAGPDSGGYARSMRELAARLGLQDSVTFLGEAHDTEKWALFEAADLFVLPSHSENFGIAVGEALLAGLPVITTARTPWCWVQREGCGWCVEPRTESVTAALGEATRSSPDALARMGEIGRQITERRYAWAVVAKQMAEVYGWLLAGGPRPTSVQER